MLSSYRPARQLTVQRWKLKTLHEKPAQRQQQRHKTGLIIFVVLAL